MDIVDLHMGVEHRQHGAKLAASGKQWKKAGWKHFLCPATPTVGPNGEPGSSGGVWCMVKGHRQTTHIGHIGGSSWVGAMVRFRGYDVLFVISYLQDSVGWGGRNGDTLR